MTNKDAIRVGELSNGLAFMLDYAETQEANEKKHHGDCTNEPQPCAKCWWLHCIETLNKAITLAKDYEQVKAGLPEEMFCEKHSEGNCEICDKAIRIWNNCLRKTALGLVKFKKRLPERIRKINFSYFDSEDELKNYISQAILRELEK